MNINDYKNKLELNQIPQNRKTEKQNISIIEQQSKNKE